MWTGRQTLASIEQTIARLAEQEAVLDGQMRSALGDAERLREARNEGLRELARIKLDEITAGRLVRNLDATERRAIQILESGRLRLAAETERRAAALKEMEAAEAARHQAAGEVETALSAVEAIRAEAERAVKSTPKWQAITEEVDAAVAVAEEAEKKADHARADLGQKQQPYDEDPLFLYLWRRRFGTAEYTAGNFARVLDRRVAEFIDYPTARGNYHMVLEIPKRLGEHASAKRKVAQGVAAVRADLERTAMVAAGIEPRERALAEARHRLAAADSTLEQRRRSFETIDKARAAAIGDDVTPGYPEALATIAAGDAQDDIQQLYDEARRTPTRADEQIVKKLEDIDNRNIAVEREVITLRQTAHELSRRRLEIEATRDRFRTSGYDHPHVVFGNDDVIGRVLAEVLSGVVRSGVLWDILRGGFGTRPMRGRPGFGEPSFPFPFPIPGGGDSGPFGGGWRIPESRGGWSPPPESADSRGRDDDFTTGGSI